jgi:hypothetical protein
MLSCNSLNVTKFIQEITPNILLGYVTGSTALRATRLSTASFNSFCTSHHITSRPYGHDLVSKLLFHGNCCTSVFTVKNTQQNRKNGPSLWDTLVHRQDHILKEAQQFLLNNNFKRSMMTILAETCSVK